jgi:hypothetical protein
MVTVNKATVSMCVEMSESHYTIFFFLALGFELRSSRLLGQALLMSEALCQPFLVIGVLEIGSPEISPRGWL